MTQSCEPTMETDDLESGDVAFALECFGIAIVVGIVLGTLAGALAVVVG